MRAATFTLAGFVMLAANTLPARGQYVEMYRIEKASTGMADDQILDRFSTHLKVPVEVLKREKAENDVTFGELYLIHAFSGRCGMDFGTVLSTFRSGTVWSEIAKKNNIDMKEVRRDQETLEKSLKDSRKAK